MFNASKYTQWYYLIINSAINKGRVRRKRNHPEYEYYEAHHIKPKSLGGSNDASNLVLLTPKEHCICHLLLIRMLDDPDQQLKMIYAINITINTTYRKCTSKLYTNIRLAVGNSLSKRMKGKPKSKESLKLMVATKRVNGNIYHSEEAKARMRESQANRPTQSEETRRKRSESMKGKPKSLEHKMNLSKGLKGRVPWNKGVSKENDPRMSNVGVKTDAMRVAMSEARKGKPKSEAHIQKMSINAKAQWARKGSF